MTDWAEEKAREITTAFGNIQLTASALREAEARGREKAIEECAALVRGQKKEPSHLPGWWHWPALRYEAPMGVDLVKAAGCLADAILAIKSPVTPNEPDGAIKRRLVKALRKSMTALDDWLNIYASDMCDELCATLSACGVETVRIWSGEHRAYWQYGGGNGNGYTTKFDDAGVWTRERAERLISGCGPEKQIELRSAQAPLRAERKG